MNTGNCNIIVEGTFDSTLQLAKAAITEQGFLLIHEINPQAILASHGITTGKVRQLLFFHPQYMKQLLDSDPAAVIEVPLKLVLQETGNGQTSIGYYNPATHFNGYPQLVPLSNILQEKVENIVARLKS